MRIAIISDTHFGYKEGTELEQDCYFNFEQALDYSMRNCDLILMPGDLFDLEEPSQKTLNSVFQIFGEYIKDQKWVPKTTKKKLLKVPIVAIAGTHEYKGKDYTSPIDVLESANYIYQLKNSNLTFDNVTICGMTGVPEKVAKQLITKIGFEPIEKSLNIFMTHQSYTELLAFDDEMVSTLSLEDLPKGFDLYINGHIHKKNLINTSNGPFLIPGSTIITQIKKNEILEKRGFYIYDTITKELEFLEIPLQRKYFYFEINETSTTKQELINKINAKINEIKTCKITTKYNNKELILKPVLKVKISAKLALNETTNLNEKDILAQDVILLLDKKIEVEELKNKIEAINFEQDRINALENSKKIFEKNLIDAGFKETIDIDTLINTLKEKDNEKTVNLILDRIKKDLEDQESKI
ncbi:MAG: hypothetical protein COT14_03010 [Candidatus Diapherotrites archaeon CG08_land_8_20_14_0_20_30_16]|nr:MAG: hypothetical protein COT14_03010 [Candidatus Diapherotrites archaeon CG08_land_8_20_14_0_20_30_16]